MDMDITHYNSTLRQHTRAYQDTEELSTGRRARLARLSTSPGQDTTAGSVARRGACRMLCRAWRAALRGGGGLEHAGDILLAREALELRRLVLLLLGQRQGRLGARRRSAERRGGDARDARLRRAGGALVRAGQLPGGRRRGGRVGAREGEERRGRGRRRRRVGGRVAWQQLEGTRGLFPLLRAAAQLGEVVAAERVHGHSVLGHLGRARGLPGRQGRRAGRGASWRGGHVGTRRRRHRRTVVTRRCGGRRLASSGGGEESDGDHPTGGEGPEVGGRRRHTELQGAAHAWPLVTQPAASGGARRTAMGAWLLGGVGGGRGGGDGRAACARTIPLRGAPRTIPPRLWGLAPCRTAAVAGIRATVGHRSRRAGGGGRGRSECGRRRGGGGGGGGCG